jgi:steroid 5-alpha reductase family enzyme
MSFIEIWFQGLLLIVLFFSIVWGCSVFLKNVSIVDIFWGLGFIVVGIYYFIITPGSTVRELLVLVLLILWGIRLSAHIFKRNLGKEEDYRYQEFRKKYGEKRYWWFSFFQVFLLQGALLWLISAPLLGVSAYSAEKPFGFIDVIALVFWLIGFAFEAGGDWQLSRFKSNPANKGKLLQNGLWKYTRHPNYFGDAMIWWGFALFSVASGCYLPVFSALLMNFLLLKVSGVAMLERTMKNTKPGFNSYAERTDAFLPWFPKKTTA